MLPRSLKTVIPFIAARLELAYLPRQYEIEFVYMLFRPFDTGGGHGRGEATLIDADSIANESEIDEGHLV